jgi:glycosyltransferase involved in cell wall biosynthesis
MLGGGPLRRRLEREGSPNLEVMGEVGPEELARHLAWSHVLVAPSRSDSDGWNLAAVEGLVAGRPVVTTPHVGMSELIADSPRAGRVVSADVAALTTALADVRCTYEEVGGESVSQAAAWAAHDVTMPASVARFARLLLS